MENEVVIDDKLYKAAVEGDESFLLNEAEIREKGTGINEYFVRKTPYKNNIIHVAVRHERLPFTEAAVRRFPKLICERNSHNSTPLHIAAETGNLSIVKLLVCSWKESLHSEVEGKGDQPTLPWRMQDSEGNTPLHVALLHGKLKVATFLVEEDHELAGFRNKYGETPLHLAIKHHVDDGKKLVMAAMEVVTKARGAYLKTEGCPLEKDSLTMIILLLQIRSSVACWQAANGVTPLLEAAMLNPAYMLAIEAILNHCPQSAEARDSSGKTILHLLNKPSRYEASKYLLSIPEIHALKNNQDFAGNTPAHVAVKNHDINMVSVLLESSVNLSIKNKEGVSAADLIQRQPDFQNLSIPKGGNRVIKMSSKEHEDLRNEVLIDKKLYKAAVEGDTSFLFNFDGNINREVETGYNEYFFKKTSLLNNIIHVAVQHEQLDFTRAAVSRFPKLLCETNSDINTPFHIAAETGNPSIVKLLVCSYKEFLRREEVEGDDQPKPWRKQNKQGNTPLHVALICSHPTVAQFFVDEDPELTGICNNLKETPLHLAVKHVLMDEDMELAMEGMKLQLDTIGTYVTASGCSKLQEDSLDVLELLLEKNSSVACWNDANGQTPLLLAAKRCHTWGMKIIFDHCPQSAEVPDSTSGNTILHILNDLKIYEYVLEMLATPEILALKNRKNFAGDTPAHVAVKTRDTEMAVFLLDNSADFTIKNEEGVSALDLIEQQPDLKIKIKSQVENLVSTFGHLNTREAVEKEANKAAKRAIKQNDVNFLRQRLEESGRDFLFIRYGSSRRNILHQLVFHYHDEIKKKEVQDLIEQVLETWPFLICQTDCSGMTPLHYIAVHAPNIVDKRLLRMYCKYYQKVEEEVGTEELYTPPWRAKDNHGNTPLHRALNSDFAFRETASCIRCARAFIEFDDELTQYVNDDGMTPLHLLCDSQFQREFAEEHVQEEFVSNMNFIVRRSVRSFFTFDKDILLPLHKAAKSQCFLLVNILLTCWMPLYHDGKSFLHMIALLEASDSKYKYQNLQELLAVMRSRNRIDEFYSQDEADGNTPLHLAIEKGNFLFAQFCIESTAGCGKNILDVRNKKNISPGDLIGSAKHLPYKFEKFLWSKPEVVEGMLGIRSLSGIPTTMIENYVNTLGVTAALLATITFTAAFTVPGGLNNSNGTPLLMTKPAFQVFMVSDILAMCLSMMVLFCLLWIMTVSDKKQSVVLLDLTIFLLEAAFYTTILTFMTGVYVTTFPVTPWIAIVTCVLCSLLIVLMHKSFITGLIPTFIRIFVWSRKVYLSVGTFIHHIFDISCCHIHKNNEGRKDKSSQGKSVQPAQSNRTEQNIGDCNDNSGQPAQSIAMDQQPKERASEQADLDAQALAVMPLSDSKDLQIVSPPTSAHMITIDGLKDDGASTSEFR